MPVETFRPDQYSSENLAHNQELTDRVINAHVAISMAMADLLAATAEVADSEVHWAQGSQSAPEWLVANLKIHGKTARSWSRIAKQLQDYPLIQAKLAVGELGLDQVRQLIKYVEPHESAEFLDEAAHEDAETLESHGREARTVSRDRVKRVRSERWFEGFFDHDEMKFSFRGEIPGPDGLVVDKAMQLLAWKASEEPVYELPRHPEHRFADAFVEMASNALAGMTNHDLATVVVHADADKLKTEDRVGVAEFGTDVPMEAIRRLTCDGRLQLVAHGTDGCVLGVGRVTRTIPPWLRRLVRMRDKGCRFPGCGRTYWTQIHHMIHWVHGGLTDLNNLVSLCGHHHRMLHEDGWRATGDPAGKVRWLLPSGAEYERAAGRRPGETFRDIDLGHLYEWVEQYAARARPSPG